MKEKHYFDAILALLRGSIFGMGYLSDSDKKDIIRVSDWDSVFKELISQGVFCLTLPALNSLTNIEPRLIKSYKQKCFQSQVRWHQIAYAQKGLIDILDECDIQYCIIKGMAAALYYPNPLLRSSGDVDILVARSDFHKASELLLNYGYKLKSDITRTKHHNEYYKNGVCFELHRWLGGLNENNERSIALFEANIKRREIRRVERYSFSMFPDNINGLVLLQHINQHIREGIGLKQIIDWMLFVDHCVSDEVWDNGFSELIDRLGLRTLAITATAMCQRYLGLRKNIHWCKNADPLICDELMDYIMKRGNFGVKIDEKDHIASFWITVHNPISFFKRLQKYGLLRWEKARNNRLLRPFAWMYQIKYVLKTLKHQNRSLQEMKKLHKQGKKQGELIEKLGLDR